MAIIGNVQNQGSIQGQINSANGYLTGVISDAGLLGGQVVGMRGLKGDPGTTIYSELSDKPQIEGVTLSGNKSFSDLNLVSLTNQEIEDLINSSV